MFEDELCCNCANVIVESRELICNLTGNSVWDACKFFKRKINEFKVMTPVGVPETIQKVPDWLIDDFQKGIDGATRAVHVLGYDEYYRLSNLFLGLAEKRKEEKK